LGGERRHVGKEQKWSCNDRGELQKKGREKKIRESWGITRMTLSQRERSKKGGTKVGQSKKEKGRGVPWRDLLFLSRVSKCGKDITQG